MTPFSQILEVHEDLLKAKGYDEAGLSSPDKPGFFLKQLERQLSLAIRQAHQSGEPCEFEMKAAGFFNNDADLILFTFHYAYDPEKMELQLQCLEAKMDGKQHRFELEKNTDLPTCGVVRRSFAKDDKMEMARTIAEHTVQVNGKRLLKTTR